MPNQSTNPKPKEFRVKVSKAEKNYLPQNFCSFLHEFSPSLVSFEAWRSEGQTVSELSKLEHLQQLWLFCDSEAINFFPSIANLNRQLSRLHIHWVVDRQFSSQDLITFGSAMACFDKLEALSLEINWQTFNFDGPQQQTEWTNFKSKWTELCQQKLSQSITKLSIDIKHNNFCREKLNSNLVADLLVNRNLSYLRVVASLMDMFPIKIHTVQKIHTLELVFNYAKIYREIAILMNPFENFPTFESDVDFIFEIDFRDTVRMLKLKYW